MKKIIKKILTNWVIKNYPFKITTKVIIVKTIYVKKGKIMEWRSFDEKGNRIPVIKNNKEI